MTTEAPHPVSAVHLALALVALPVCTALADPLTVTDRYPVARIHGLPAAQPSRLSDRPASELALSVDWSSNAIARGNDRETLILDGESVAVTARYRRTAGAWRLGMDVPILHQSGGVLDGVIDGFHDLFDLPEGDRPKLPKDALLYRYERNGQTLLEVAGNGSGLGDVSLHAARALRDTPTYAVAARVHLKLPTGDSDRLFGSGATGVGVAIDAVRDGHWRERPLQWYGGVGVQWSEDGDVLPSLRESLVAYGHGGVAYAWRPSIALTVQLDGHSAYYDSDQRGLGGALMFSAGARFALGGGWRLGAAFVEDIAPRTVPDVVFHLTLSKGR